MSSKHDVEPGLKEPRHDEAEHRRAANKAVGISAIGLGLTGLIELAIAIITGSVALLGDALHNLSDVSTSLVVFIGFRISKRKPSKRFTYGYERAEDLAGLGVALVIWVSAIFAGYESYHKLATHGRTSAVYVGMAGAILGIAGNQIVARYKMRVGRKINSATLVADAKHSWLDALSSAGALIGLIFVAFGIRVGDPIAGFAVTLLILHVGYEVTSELSHHLMDGVDEAHIEAATHAALSVHGINAATVRGRWMGRSLIFDVEGSIDPALTIAEAETLRKAVESSVLDAVEEARVVHFVPRASSR
ncbi:MAG: cation diffusion facilitator family transporter [Actinomycetota bacterium]